MSTTAALLIFAVAAIAVLSVMALREHRDLVGRRGRLLDSAAGFFAGGKITIAPDGFPVLDGRLADSRRIRIELIADTLVFRRLPQLWLKLTLAEHDECDRPSIGALSRPTGAEFYSMVHDLPEWMAPPQTDGALLMRGDGRARKEEIERAAAMFQSLFRDPAVKEAVITPRGVRLIRQAAEGDRGAHLLLRQVRFPVEEISPALIRQAVGELEALSATLTGEKASLAELVA